MNRLRHLGLPPSLQKKPPCHPASMLQQCLPDPSPKGKVIFLKAMVLPMFGVGLPPTANNILDT